MTRSTLVLSVLLLSGTLGHAEDSATTQPAADNGWDGKWFSYEKALELMVAESTPTDDQLNFRMRPRQQSDKELQAGPTRARPAVIANMNILHLRFRSASGEIVPALLCTPRDKPGPNPVVIAAHGAGSNKAQVCGQVAPALTRRGFAVLAPDLPLHGERPGDPRTILRRDDLVRTFQLYRQAVIDIRQCIDVAQTRPELDAARGVILAGYSMGSWVNSVVGPTDERVRAMVLMVGGAMEIAPAALLLPQVAAVDPRLALAHFSGRPLLMLSARRDTVVTPEMTRRLFAAAAQPKEQIWYESGHRLPNSAYQDAAEWVERTWKAIAAPTP